MASRRTQVSKTKPLTRTVASDSEDDLNFLASQQSNGSDDQALEMAIAKHYAVLREKKRKEGEKNFLKTAYKQLSQDVATPTDEVKCSVTAIEALYSDFLQQYAANEDLIHKLWTQIQKEQQKLVALTKKRLALNTEAGKKVEEGHITGLSRTKAACREYQEVINQIVPPDQ
ncbi:hypothetical protein Hypma_000994 [Hypsizygus marmoreus]|uniref:Uncharacterized protein n=1 Tax=Hypsizygus marmoreus TaxID=39966 RepID=A0A369J7V1_HYPMA|nr:hypothetical protein Hypma_000994 [Hypsizygus marmoreus]